MFLKWKVEMKELPVLLHQNKDDAPSGKKRKRKQVCFSIKRHNAGKDGGDRIPAGKQKNYIGNGVIGTIPKR